MKYLIILIYCSLLFSCAETDPTQNMITKGTGNLTGKWVSVYADTIIILMLNEDDSKNISGSMRVTEDGPLAVAHSAMPIQKIIESTWDGKNLHITIENRDIPKFAIIVGYSYIYEFETNTLIFTSDSWGNRNPGGEMIFYQQGED